MISSLGHKYNILGHIIPLLYLCRYYIIVVIGVGTPGVEIGKAPMWRFLTQ